MPRAPTKIYTACFDNVTEPLKFVFGLRDAGLDLRANDLVFFPDKPQRVVIRLQNGFLGRKVVNALRGFILNGQSLYSGGAQPEDQIEEVDPRGGFATNVFIPEAADIQRCVTEAFTKVQFRAKGEGEAIKSPKADEVGPSNKKCDENSEEDSVGDQTSDLAESQAEDQDEELSDDPDSSSEEEPSDSE